MSVKISFDNELAVASIPLGDWAPSLVEHLGRYFDVREGILRLDYAHLSAENTSVASDWLGMWLPDRENFTVKFEHAARQGAIALTLAILGHGSTGIKGSSSILDEDAYGVAEAAFRKDAFQGGSRPLRETIMAAIAPREIWVSWLLDAHSSDRSRFWTIGRSWRRWWPVHRRTIASMAFNWSPPVTVRITGPSSSWSSNIGSMYATTWRPMSAIQAAKYLISSSRCLRIRRRCRRPGGPASRFLIESIRRSSLG